jgi:HD-GYP domain-containing protein (c-di-GMP phosphodiesterase class II)
MAAPMETGLRVCLIATRLAQAASASPDELFRTYYLALLRHIGCTAANREMVGALGDELEFRRTMVGLDPSSTRELFPHMVRRVVGLRRPIERPAALVELAVKARGMTGIGNAVCEVAQLLAGRLRLGPGLQHDIAQVYERYDGHGYPNRVPGSEVTLPAQAVHVAEAITIHERIGGRAGAMSMLAERRGKALRPDLVDLVRDQPDQILAEPAGSAWDAVMDTEPGQAPRVSGIAIDEILRALGDFVDLKSPFTVGHSAQVAQLAGDAAAMSGLPPAEVTRLRRAGWVHDVGRLSVSLAVWEKKTPLSRDEWEQMRLHPYVTGRILARPPLLAALGTLAGAHHERLDGSGYHRGDTAASLSPAARILQVADACSTLLGERPHRPAQSAAQVARSLRVEAQSGRLDPDAVDAVLQALGQLPRRRRTAVRGLTAREVEVLGLLATGRSNREIAAELVLSTKTVGHHIESIYAKAAVSTRAGATMFAMEHGLVAPRPD